MYKKLLDIYIELLAKIYNYLLDSYYNCLFATNLRYIYYIIFLY